MIDEVKIRKDFPIFDKNINGKPVVYFDSACMSLKPRQVVEAMSEYYFDYPACAGRSSHRLGEMATKKIKETRQSVAQFINAKSEKEIVFTRNTTESINLVDNSFDLKAGDLVLTTDKEHNSNLIPWQLLSKRKSIRHEIVKSKEDGEFDVELFKEMVKGAKLVSMVHRSNLDGTAIPAKEIIKIAHENGALVLLDAAQSIPHQKVDVKDLDVDFLAFSGHKMLGPTGTGVLYGKYKLLEELEPFLVGGDTVSESTYVSHKFLPPPEKFEAGLQDYAGMIGLGEAVKYINKVGFNFIQEQELLLNEYITNESLNIKDLTIIGQDDPAKRSGIVSFYIKNKDHHQIALMLDETSKIMVRSGQHCVHSWFHAHKIPGSVRASVYFYNTLEEAEIFVRELKKVVSIL